MVSDCVDNIWWCPSFCSPSDVDGKVIHLVERAPPQASISGSGGAGASATGVEGGSISSSHVSTSSQGAPHDRNGNSYVMLGTFNLPVNIMDPQQIQVGMLHSVFVKGTKRSMLCDSRNLFCRCLFSRWWLELVRLEGMPGSAPALG